MYFVGSAGGLMGWFHPILFFTSAFTQFTISYSALSRPKGRTRLLLEILRSTFRTSVHLTTVLHRRAQLKIRNHFFEFDWTLWSSSFWRVFHWRIWGAGLRRWRAAQWRSETVCLRPAGYIFSTQNARKSLTRYPDAHAHARCCALFSLLFSLLFLSFFPPLVLFFLLLFSKTTKWWDRDIIIRVAAAACILSVGFGWVRSFSVVRWQSTKTPVVTPAY